MESTATRFVQHPLLKENSIQQREYQELIVSSVMDKGNSLVVAPTALGKTMVAGWIAARVLEAQPTGKVLFLAPTKPLAVQHQKSLQRILNIPSESIALLTGTVTPKDREIVWNASRVISATPQTIENDLMTRQLSLKDVSLIVFDEAHRAMGDYAYVFIAQAYVKQREKPFILGLTASPGGESERIQDVCKNLFIQHVEVKTLGDEDVQPYVNEIETEFIKVNLPEEFAQVKDWLQAFNSDQVAFFHKIGYGKRLHPTYIRQKDLLELQARIRKDLQYRAQQHPALYQAASKVAALFKINHAITLLETQGIGALSDYFEKMENENTQSGASKALKSIMKDERILNAIRVTRELQAKGVSHPKVEKLKEILSLQFQENPNSRVIVFNHYRDSIKNVVAVLEKIPGLKPCKFVGQASKIKDEGMSQKTQGKALQEFREGKYNVLCASSVAEEGLDIPEVDLVVFFETVPSEIRTIQRRGRTGRWAKGRCVVLLAKGTRDEAFHYSSQRKERKMHETLNDIQQEMKAMQPLAKQETLVKFVEEAKEKAIIYADTREQYSKIAQKLQSMGAFVKVKQMEVGDFVLSDEIVVERKTVEDFLQSMIDGRLFDQLKKMSENYPAPLLLIEGSLEELFTARNIHKNSIMGALTSIAVNYRIPFLFSRGETESAEYLFSIAKREQLGKEKEIKLRVGRKGFTLAEQQQFIVESLPAVGPTLAKKLLKEFGTVEKVFTAKEKELQNVDKVGEKKAKEIRKVVEGKFETEKEL